MTLEEYKMFADDLAQKAGVEGGLHGYFLGHRNRLWKTASHFDLWSLRNRKILEIGPFFSYTPFLLKKQGNEVHVMEGEDPAVYPLKPLYQEQGISFSTCDLFESFGSSQKEKHTLPFGENQFDLISCWENMEHFNFNPVGFIRDLHRVLKPGGEAFITVPNMAKLENRIKLFAGKSIGTPVESYNQFYNYANGRFLGFHWREYVMSELTYLFGTQNFSIVSAKHLLTFHNHQSLSASVKIRRMLFKPVFSLVPSTGNLCAIIARKPLSNGK
jgi:SAM-dependent methyltransferase